MYFGGYGLYLLFSLPALLLGLWAQMKVKSAFAKYSKVGTTTGLTGAEVARRMLDSNGLNSVPIEETGGTLSDHYDPSKKVLRLSSGVYRSPSVAAAGVAAHESGHAVQDKEKYGPHENQIDHDPFRPNRKLAWSHYIHDRFVHVLTNRQHDCLGGIAALHRNRCFCSDHIAGRDRRQQSCQSLAGWFGNHLFK